MWAKLKACSGMPYRELRAHVQREMASERFQVVAAEQSLHVSQERDVAGRVHQHRVDGRRNAPRAEAEHQLRGLPVHRHLRAPKRSRGECSRNEVKWTPTRHTRARIMLNNRIMSSDRIMFAGGWAVNPATYPIPVVAPRVL